MMENNDLIGRQIGNYRIEELLSDSGGFAKVYLGKHIHIDRLVVIKLLRASQASPEQKEQILQEARFLETLKHKYILPIRDTGIQNGVPYLLIEFAPNGSLRDLLRKRHQSPLSTEEALTILSQVGQALQFAHHHHVLHRDLKPGNILFNADNEALLADFGIALKLDTARTQSVNMVGTPAYMAPEQFAGKASPKSDQYALGCIAYELFTGRKVFSIAPDSDQPQLAWIYQHTNAIPVPPTKLNPNLPAHIEQAILKALAKNRDDRHIDVSAFLIALGLSPAQVTVPNMAAVLSQTSLIANEERDISTEPRKTIQQWLDEGDGHFQAKRCEEALAAYEQSLRFDPKSARACYAKGRALEQLKRYVEASAAYEQAILLDPTSASSHIGKGNISFIFKQYEEAIAEYKSAIRLDPKLVLGYKMLGRTLTELKRYAEAIAAYEAVVRQEPESLDSYYRIGELYIALKHLTQAIESYNQIIRLKPDAADAHYKKATLLEQLKRYDEALAVYDQIFDLNLDNSFDAYYKKAALLEKLERFDEAISFYDRAIRLKPDESDVYHKKIVILEQLKRYDEIIISYDKLIIVNLNPIETILKKAALLEQLKRYSEAAAAYKQIISLTSDKKQIQVWQNKIWDLNITKICYKLAPFMYILAFNPLVNALLLAILYHSWWLILAAPFGGLLLISAVAGFVSKEVESEKDQIGCIMSFSVFLASFGWFCYAGQLTSSVGIAIIVTLVSLIINGLIAVGFYVSGKVSEMMKDI